ncbi:NAD-dependent epimerase/dehydratase family protein [Litorivivens sp.]|uniref:NAD-dependent epimerase/dehydratase family protein n=1 Tax=Litorivivens sp. TaxID=2020868 RepID=UPI0035690547
MAKRVLLTGAFGNIGTYTIEYLLERGYELVCVDRKLPGTESIARRFGQRIKAVWGDITEPAVWDEALTDVDVVIHLAAIIPPLSETQPELATRVNVTATENLIAAMEARGVRRLIFASSVAVYGKLQDREPPLTADSPYRPDDHYGETKLACEKAIHASSLDWSILRISVAPPVEVKFIGGNHDFEMIFDIAVDTRIEYVHPADCALAFANAVACDEAIGKHLLLGGGPSCQCTGKEFNDGILAAYGIPAMPDHVFKKGTPAFYGDYLDTEESQRLLQFQRHSLHESLMHSRKSVGVLYYVIKLFGPLIRTALASRSPYR